MICPQTKAVIVIGFHYVSTTQRLIFERLWPAFCTLFFANYSAAVVYFVATVITKNLLNNMLREEKKYEKGTRCKSSRKL